MSDLSSAAGGPASRAVLVSVVFRPEHTARNLGEVAYSYRFVYAAFAPLLARWAATREVAQPESRLDFAVRECRRAGQAPAHLSFLPLHQTYLTAQAPNAAFPFWEFPDVPAEDLGNNPRQNWLRIADRLDLVLTASAFTRDAFLRAGTRTPVRVVPVPVPAEYFALPPWRPGQRVVLDCPCYTFPQGEAPDPARQAPWAPVPAGRSLKARARQVYHRHLRRFLPHSVQDGVTRVMRAIRSRPEDMKPLAFFPRSAELDLSGIVYTTVLNPNDPRKNWHDLLSAFLLALADREDATLVLKVVVSPALLLKALNLVYAHYRRLGVRHRCRLALVPDYLSDEQMRELARGSTYYLNTSHAEGACLPLQDFLAAGRPGVAPSHTALADYFHDGVGFVVASHPEPTCWPHDPDGRCTTTWHRLVWQSLGEQLRASYAVARSDTRRYRSLAEQGRAEMAAFAGAEQVWPRLAAALDVLAPERFRAPAAAA
jgi:glycosyltransferase involved in cell wall biosynthesis